MSKIEKALARAKQSRRTQATDIHQRGSSQYFEPTQQHVVYSQTRVVKLSKSHLEKHRLLTLLDEGPAIDCYNVLSTRILESTNPKKHKSIMVTSCVDGEGKTVTAINLTVSIARRAQHSALLVDIDLRQPQVRSYLGLNTQRGLSDHLKNDVPISELLINPGLPGIVVLPAGRPLPGSTEILGSPKMEKLVRETAIRYPERYVIFDCPPLLLAPDSMVFSAYVDGIILVVEASKTPRKQILEAIELLKDRPLLGLVMNKSTRTRKGYYYYRPQ